jgi:hypothetical protein
MVMSAEAGLNLISETFDSHFDVDESIISGMLTALNTCSGEIFSKQLEKLCFGDYTLLMRFEQPLLFCYIFKGDCESANFRLNEIIDYLRIDFELWSSLLETMRTGTIDHRVTFRIRNFLTQILTHAAY